MSSSGLHGQKRENLNKNELKIKNENVNKLINEYKNIILNLEMVNYFILFESYN